ncbi:MAG: extracellular solute-binding protein family 1 [Clostridia bacterium]|jgi:alpha-1,4-digalacturonate transport system substrate-binding protein|uniref:ABC transporter substrate-binding protein n=1 Tax=Petroclostridium xylanilyticum TaxID=1792311 RepID=UPI0012FF9AE2|nr:sugar ABC transporter substrate-binding protein [Petroclostridium xylanilyticum]MBZ4646495.1 extracellular solute-binding protein family 1 [Clostridia bacterium]
MKKFTIILSILMAISFAFVGCSSKNNQNNVGKSTNENSAKTEDSTKKNVVLKFLIADDTNEGGAMAYIAQKYEKEKGIKVEMIEVPYEKQPSKLQTMIQGGDAPALVRATKFKVYKDYLLDISDIVDLSVIPESLHEKMKVDGKVVVIPSNVTANGMIYNKTAFEKAGVKIPTSPEEIWTWEEFVAAVKKVVDSGAVKYGLVWDHSQQRFQTLMYQFGGSIFNEDVTKVVANSKEGEEALKYFIKLHDDGIIPKSVWLGSEDPSAMFKSGQVAVHMAGNWKINDYQQNIKDFEWGAVYMPKGTIRSSVPGGNFVFAVKGSKVEAEAKEFLKWFYSPEVYKEYCEKGAYMSSRTDVTPKYQYGNEAYAVFNDELKNTPAIAGIDYTNEFSDFVGNLLRDNIEYAMKGEKTPKKALDDFAAELSKEMGLK